MKSCRYCTKHIRDNAAACPFCGGDLSEPASAEVKRAEPAAAEAHSTHRLEPIYFPVSATKFILLNLASFGTYTLFWFYRNWRLEKARTGENISPFWRTVFAGLFAYSLFVRIRDRASEASVPTSYSPGALALTCFLLNASWRLPDPIWLISVFVFVPLLPVRAAVARINDALTPNAWKNTGLSWNGVGLMIGWVLVIPLVGMLYTELTPKDFKASFSESMVPSCVEEAVSAGTSEDRARQWCGCVIRQYLDDNRPSQLLFYGLRATLFGRELPTGAAISMCTEKVNAEAKEQFKASYMRTFAAECTKSVMNNGLAKAQAKSLCDCTAQRMVERHTTAELIAYESKRPSPEVAQALTAAASTCGEN